MQLYQSKSGFVMSKESWERELDKFWKIFEGSSSIYATRPIDAWERYVNVMKLKAV